MVADGEAVISRRTAGALTVGVLVFEGEAAPAIPPALVCKMPRQDTRTLPAAARHGLVQHLEQYPAVGLASPRDRRVARAILSRLVESAERGSWRSPRAARRAGYATRTRSRAAGDRSVRFFHAERRQEPRRGSIFDAARPKALIYANVPGDALILVGAMWSTRDGEAGPTPAGPIMRWHSHVVCKEGTKRGLKPLAGGKCPPGARLTQGASEMLHVWFTGDLRSAYAITAPRPELCGASVLPRASCR